MQVLLSRCSPSKLHSVASVGSTKKWFLPGTNWKESSNISLEKRLRVSKPAIVACASVVSKKPLLGMQYIALCLCVCTVGNGYHKNVPVFWLQHQGLHVQQKAQILIELQLCQRIKDFLHNETAVQ